MANIILANIKEPKKGDNFFDNLKGKDVIDRFGLGEYIAGNKQLNSLLQSGITKEAKVDKLGGLQAELGLKSLNYIKPAKNYIDEHGFGLNFIWNVNKEFEKHIDNFINEKFLNKTQTDIDWFKVARFGIENSDEVKNAIDWMDTPNDKKLSLTNEYSKKIEDIVGEEVLKKSVDFVK
jgi:hypothetical protein